MVGLNLVYDVLAYPVYVSTLIGKFVVVTCVYSSYFVLFVGFQTWVDLIILYMMNFDVVLDMI